jgi:hypothetical protein
MHRPINLVITFRLLWLHYVSNWAGKITEIMNREEVSKRFNALPREHRVTIIGNELEQEIRWLEREKRDAIKAHAKNLERYNERIKTLTRSLNQLQDD